MVSLDLSWHHFQCAVGAVALLLHTVSDTGLKPDVLFVFDLQLPASFQPKPQDGEVHAVYP
jgi:hypothetical protein